MEIMMAETKKKNNIQQETAIFAELKIRR